MWEVFSPVAGWQLEPLAQPKRHEFMATLIHYATLHIIPNAGHYPTLEQPDIFNAALTGMDGSTDGSCVNAAMFQFCG